MDIPRARPRNRSRLVAALLGCAALVLALGASARLRRAGPTVSPSGLVIATVERGLFLREVRAAGRLVPEEVRWVTTVTAGRVERIVTKPGVAVTADTIIVELSNPDIVVAALQADRELATARRQALELESRLRTQGLTEEGSVATLEADTNDVDRRLIVYTKQEGLIVGKLEVRQTEQKAEELHRRLDLGRRRVGVVADTLRQAIAAHRDEIARREEEANFRREQVKNLAVRAGAKGLLADVVVEPGQWAAPGAVLAQVVGPERLKAELRVPEAQAKDVGPEQRVRIDVPGASIEGQVRRVAAGAKDGTVLVEVALPHTLPAGARPQLHVEGSLEIETIADAVFVERPSAARPESATTLFRLDGDGATATRVPVQLGRASARSIEVRAGLAVGDRVVVSDTSAFDGNGRVSLK